MNKPSPVSVRLQPELNDQLVALAEAMDRPKSWVIEQAVKDYVSLQAWQLAAIEEGIREADAGKLIPHDEIASWVGSWDSPDEKPPPECG